jgi:hypothetical protein
MVSLLRADPNAAQILATNATPHTAQRFLTLSMAAANPQQPENQAQIPSENSTCQMQ